MKPVSLPQQRAIFFKWSKMFKVSLFRQLPFKINSAPKDVDRGKGHALELYNLPLGPLPEQFSTLISLDEFVFK